MSAATTLFQCGKSTTHFRLGMVNFPHFHLPILIYRSHGAHDSQSQLVYRSERFTHQHLLAIRPIRRNCCAVYFWFSKRNPNNFIDNIYSYSIEYSPKKTISNGYWFILNHGNCKYFNISELSNEIICVVCKTNCEYLLGIWVFLSSSLLVRCIVSTFWYVRHFFAVVGGVCCLGYKLNVYIGVSNADGNAAEKGRARSE